MPAMPNRTKTFERLEHETISITTRKATLRSLRRDRRLHGSQNPSCEIVIYLSLISDIWFSHFCLPRAYFLASTFTHLEALVVAWKKT